MSHGNELVSQDAAERLDIKTGGASWKFAGNGHGIEKYSLTNHHKFLG